MVVNELYYGAETTRKQVQLPVAESSAISIDDSVIAAALRNIYRRDFNPHDDIEPNLFNAIAKILGGAVSEAAPTLGEDPFFHALRHSTDVFSAFKVHRAQNDMAARLLDSNGNLKPFKQWKEEVLPIADHQCHNWLQTEYDTAVLRARQAADWQQFQAEKDVLPNLKWLPSTSPNPGADHRPFWNTILPVDHPFWDQHRPGDRWNCKCSLTSTDEPATAVPSVPSEPSVNNPQPGLKENPGKSQAVFSDDHPYFPSDCRHCAFYNPTVEARLQNVFTARVKDCYHCPYIDGCIDGVTKVNQKVAEHIQELKKQLHQYQGEVVKDSKYITGQIRVLRRSLTDIVEHDREDALLMQWLSRLSLKDFKGWKYEGWAENRPYEPGHPKYDPTDPNKKKHPETQYFLYYSKNINGKKYWANVKMHRDYNGEVIYTIEPKEPEDLIRGIP